MANERLFGPKTRIGLASVYHFADWQNPTAAELNENPTNDLTGSKWDLSCALDLDNTTFDLGDSETDDELSFCQTAGAQNPTDYNPEVAFTAFMSKDRYIVSDPSTRDQANTAFALLFARGVEYYAWMSRGKEPGEPFAIGDRVSLVRVITDYGVPEIGTGANAKLVSTLGFRTELLWNYKLTA